MYVWVGHARPGEHSAELGRGGCAWLLQDRTGQTVAGSGMAGHELGVYMLGIGCYLVEFVFSELY